MVEKIDEILLPESISDNFVADPPFDSLEGIKRLNVLIGPNNSGKSRLLRSLFKCKNTLVVSTADEVPRGIRTKIRELLKQIAALAVELPQFGELLAEARQAIQGVSFSFAQLKDLGSMNGVRQSDIAAVNSSANKIQNEHRIRLDVELNSKFSQIRDELQQIGSLVRKFSQSSQTQLSPSPPPIPIFQNAQFVYVPLSLIHI